MTLNYLKISKFGSKITKITKNRWCETLTGKSIKIYLQSFGNWKNAPRGNPRLGGKIAYSNKIKKKSQNSW